MKRVQLLILFILFLVALSIHWLLSIKESFADVPPASNPDLSLNVGGPSWGQYVIKRTLIPSSISLGSTFNAGSIPITVSTTVTPYSDNNTYYIGNVVSFSGNNYLNLAYKDPRGPAYSGSYQSSPTKDKNVWAQVALTPTPPSPDLVYNTGGPSWGQYTIKRTLIPSTISLGSTINAGSIPITVSKTIKTYSDNDTYFLGDVVSFNGNNYLNLAYKDPRGPAYSGSYQSSPTKDTNVWTQITIASTAPIPQAPIPQAPIPQAPSPIPQAVPTAPSSFAPVTAPKTTSVISSTETPLTSSNISLIFDNTISKFVAYYQSLVKEPSYSTNIQILRRIKMSVILLNGINKGYTSIKENINNSLPIPYGLSTQDIQPIVDFLTSPISTYKDIREPITANDINMFLSKLSSIKKNIDDKSDKMGIPKEEQAGLTQVLSVSINNITALKNKIPQSRLIDIPVLKSDLNVFVLLTAFHNFAVSPEEDSAPLEQLDISNLPSAKPITSKLNDIATTISDTIDETTKDTIYKKEYSNLPSGMKFSEIIDDVIQAYDAGDLGSNDEADNSGPSNYKSSYYDEISSKLNTVPLGPKDYYNKNLSGRCTDTIRPIAPNTNSDALQQGAWFRNQRQNSPYANSQCPEETSTCNSGPMPSVINNNDYIRKDSIPCWGCKLK